MSRPTLSIDQLIDDERIPDPMMRHAIRAVLRLRLHQEREKTEQAQQEKHEAWVQTLKQSPIAELPDAANAQHYEVPAEIGRASCRERV